jgi:hypothetical protein
VLQRDRASLFASPGDVAMNHSVPVQDELEIEAAANVTRVEFVAEELAAPTGLEPAACSVTGGRSDRQRRGAISIPGCVKQW